jgi:hypothetical protein
MKPKHETYSSASLPRKKKQRTYRNRLMHLKVLFTDPYEKVKKNITLNTTNTIRLTLNGRSQSSCISDSQPGSCFQALQSKRQVTLRALLLQADLEICQRDFEYLSQNNILYSHWTNILEVMPESRVSCKTASIVSSTKRCSCSQVPLFYFKHIVGMWRAEDMQQYSFH